MKTTEDKLLEKLVDTIMKDSKLETPSIDFTKKVMSQVVKSKMSESYVYEPLIPKSVFIIVLGCLFTLFIYVIANGETQKDGWINHLYINKFYNSSYIKLFNFSKISIYAVAFASIMLLIQIVFLKKYFEKIFDYN